MIVTFKPSVLRGTVTAPASKSMAHRYLIGAALSGQRCVLTGVDYSEDILATIDCLRALGATVTTDSTTVTVDPRGFMQVEHPILHCRESGSTLRFFIPLCLCLGKTVTLRGSERLFERPLEVYEDLCRENSFTFQKDSHSLTLCGTLRGGTYRLRGDISSQFITGLLFALIWLGEDAALEIIPPFESRPYVELTLSVLTAFGADVSFVSPYTIAVKPAPMHPLSVRVEGDYSNAAFLSAFTCVGGEVTVENLNPVSLQGDRVYADYFERLCVGSPTLDISDCPDLAPILIAVAALKHGATLIGTNRLRAKESDRGGAMHAELQKLGGGLTIGDNTITVPPQSLRYNGVPLYGHNDHRIVMALSVILSKIGGTIEGAEAVNKSYPRFFEDMTKLGAKVIVE